MRLTSDLAIAPASSLWISILFLAASGCHTVPPVQLPPGTVEGGPEDSLYERDPVDIAVLPVFTGDEYEPALRNAIRDELKDHLLEKRYSPLAFEAIDDKLGAFPDSRELDLNQIRGNFDEDALLYVRLLEWDDTHFVRQQTMIVSIRFTLYDSRTGNVLWERRTSGMPLEAPNPMEADERSTTEYFASVLVGDAMATLPGKDELQREAEG